MPATLALLGLMFPWARLVATSIHLAEDHHGVEAGEPAAPGRAAATLEEAFHGHHHDEGSTSHDHPLVSCDFSGQRSRAMDAVAQPEARPAIFPVNPPSRVSANLSRPVGTRGHGPPRALSPAILRI